MESVHTPQVHGVLIARHGTLVLEEYFHGEHRDKLHDTRSAAKSLTATIVGAVIQAGGPLKLSTPVYEIMNGGAFPADVDPRKRAMTLEHLLTMSSGFFCDDSNPNAPGNEETMLDQTDEPDYYRYTLSLPMASAPGEKAIYCSINPNLALGVVGRAMGESPLYTFDRLIGAPLKIHRYGWLLDPAGHPYGGGSVQLLPRDFMKLGQLMLNGGQGVMVIPELDLVIATYGGNCGDRIGIHIQQELIPRYILPAVREPGDDKSAPVIQRDYVSPYGPSSISGPVRSRDQ